MVRDDTLFDIMNPMNKHATHVGAEYLQPCGNHIIQTILILLCNEDPPAGRSQRPSLPILVLVCYEDLPGGAFTMPSLPIQIPTCKPL
ncbi:hypothetical protein CJD36_000205 [Flavipsychrobacter stenotrophus]|uniref:Uncharacterized protein n=1 Tax=Flavipsychrobacter stenotrophus TaxID=2077091 RepID=A0A2S7SZU9_9BACT|nr:hypothetical protein CJD36_000205 [Flavipsychrobacter stenotrophus]